MSAPNPFDAFTQQAHEERIVTAVGDILLADPEIQAFCNGRVTLSPSPLVVPGSQLPLITVAISQEDEVSTLQNEAEVTTRVVIQMVFVDRRDRFTPEQAALTMMSGIHKLRTLFATGGDQEYLAVPRYNGQNLIDKLESIEPLDYFAATSRPLPDYGEPGDPPVEPEQIEHYVSFNLNYQWKADRSTWEYVFWQPL